MGTCDAFCEVVWQGQTAKTAVKKNSYSPDWDETFAFFFADISAGITDLEGALVLKVCSCCTRVCRRAWELWVCAFSPPAAKLLILDLATPTAVVVKDWDRLTNPDEVGRVLIPAETLLGFLQQREAATEEGSFAVLKEVSDASFLSPTDQPKKKMALLRARARTHTHQTHATHTLLLLI